MPGRVWVILWLGLLCAPAPRLAAADVIHWLTAENPPIYISEGELAGQGVGDQQLSFLKSRLADFEHQVIRADSARITYEIQHSDPTCVVGILHSPERDRSALFTSRPNIVPGYRFLILASRRSDFNGFLSAEGAVDLTRLADHGELRGVYVGGRPNSGTVDEFIKSATRRANLEKVPQAAQLANLLLAKHVDFAFAPGFEINFYLRRDGTDRRFLALPIVGMPPLLRNYVACSDGPRGRRVIARINDIIGDEHGWASFVAPLERWDDPDLFAATARGIQAADKQ